MIVAPLYFQNHILQKSVIHETETVTSEIQSKLKVENEKMKVRYKSKKKDLCDQCDKEVMKNTDISAVLAYTL